jgi:hypothetical protein
MKTISSIIILLAVIIGGWYLFQDDDIEISSLTLDVTLDPLQKGHYEGWAIFGEEKVSTGKFNIGDSLVFTSARDLSDADAIVVTIEPEGDTDSVPSGIVVLSGVLASDAEEAQTITLSFPVDLATASGSYILATPTNGNDTDETSGIWFLKLPPPPSAGLVLPNLPSGWVYEGWAVHNGIPITSGRFSSAEGVDFFNEFSGPEGSPPFPGEDYLINAPAGLSFPINLANGSSKVVISIEPDSNGEDPTGDGPFQVKPLVADVPEGALDHTNYPMQLNMDSIPSGLATIN